MPDQLLSADPNAGLLSTDPSAGVPPSSAASRFTGGVADALLSPVHFAKALVTNPKGLYEHLVNQSAEDFEKAGALWDAKQYGPAIHRAIAGVIPPYQVVPDAADKMRAGDVAGGLGEAVGTGLLPKVTEGAVGAIKAVPAARAALVEPAGAVINAVAKRFGVDADALALKATKMDLQRAKAQTRIAKGNAQIAKATAGAPAPTAAPESPVAAAEPEPELVKAPIPLDQAANAVQKLAAADKIKVPAADFTSLTALVKEGYPKDQVWEVYKAHKAAETLQQRLGTPTDAQVESDVTARNATGRWGAGPTTRPTNPFR